MKRGINTFIKFFIGTIYKTKQIILFQFSVWFGLGFVDQTKHFTRYKTQDTVCLLFLLLVVYS